MSHVDNWLLLPASQFSDDGKRSHRQAVEAVNAALLAADPERRQVFRPLAKESWGGAKYPETPVYGLAANHLPERHVLAAVARADWPEPHLGLLLLMRQEDEDWTVFRLADLVATARG